MKKIFLYPTLFTTLFISLSFKSYSMHSSFAARKASIRFETKNEIDQNGKIEKFIQVANKSYPYDFAEQMPTILFDRYDVVCNLPTSTEDRVSNILDNSSLIIKDKEIILTSSLITDVIDPDWKIFITHIFGIG